MLSKQSCLKHNKKPYNLHFGLIKRLLSKFSYLYMAKFLPNVIFLLMPDIRVKSMLAVISNQEIWISQEIWSARPWGAFQADHMRGTEVKKIKTQRLSRIENIKANFIQTDKNSSFRLGVKTIFF